MSTILDIPEQKPKPANNLRKSLRLFFVYAVVTGLFVGAIIFGSVSGSEPNDLFFGIVGFVFIATMLLSPVGLYFSVRAWLKKEGSALQRVFHTAGHAVVLLVLIMVIGMVIDDFQVLNNNMP